MLLPLASPEVHVWYRATGELEEAATSADLALLSAGERARYERLAVTRDRRDFAAAHALTRRVLSLYEDLPPAGWTFETTAEGKPFVAPAAEGAPPLAFNLSHSRGLVACAVTRGADVGVDVESLDRPVDGTKIATEYFSPAENALLDACAKDERERRFVELWTLKEAYLKATGRGFADSLSNFGFAFDGIGGIRFDPPPGVNAGEWTFGLFPPSPRACIAVAVRSQLSALTRSSPTFRPFP